MQSNLPNELGEKRLHDELKERLRGRRHRLLCMGEFECPGFASACCTNFQFSAVFFFFFFFFSVSSTAKIKLTRLGMSTILSQQGREQYTQHFGRFTPGGVGGGVLNRDLGREVRPGRSNPDPV